MAHQETFVDSNGKTKTLQLRFNREARMVYKSGSLEELEENGYELLIKYINHHKTIQRPRIRELLDYAEGNNHGVLEGEQRRLEEEVSDARAVHNFGGAVSSFKQGYLAGNPIQVSYINQTVHNVLQDVMKDNDTYEIDRTLIRDLSMCGRGYDITYHNMDGKTKVRRLDPEEVFVIYDMTLSQHSLCGVRYFNASPFDDKEEIVELYTDTYVRRFKFTGSKLEEIKQDDNFFFQVQITEYMNNILGMGDYETELTLIDLYDGAQSDTANYMKDLSDAILLVSGLIDFGVDENGEPLSEVKKIEFMKTMRKMRFMMLQPPTDNEDKVAGNVDAKYLYKQYDVAGTEAYKTRLATDFHKFTNMPDLSDQQFAGQQSGEALKHKLIGLEQERTTTESLFRKGLTRRIELIANIESLAKGTSEFEPKDLTITFTPNKTLTELDVISTARMLHGMVSELTVMEYLSKATGIDAEDELARIEEEVGEQPPPRRTNFAEVGVADGETNE